LARPDKVNKLFTSALDGIATALSMAHVPARVAADKIVDGSLASKQQYL